MKSKEPLKVCLITPHYPPEYGWYGPGRDAMELAEELRERGCHVEVIACADKLPPGETWQDGIKVIRTDWRSQGGENGLVAHSLPQSRVLMNINLSAWHAYLKVCRESEFDIVDVAGFSAESLIPAIMADCPVVASVYDSPPAFLSRELELIGDSGFKFEKLIAGSLATLSSRCVSAVCAVGAQEVEGDNVERRNYSLDTDIFSPEGPVAIDTKGRPALLIHSSIQSDRYKTLVSEIVSRVKKEVPDLWLTIVAQDIFSESSESEMKAALSQSGIECDMVINHVMARLLMPGLWRSSLCGLILDWKVMAPYALLEPLACGRPVVAESQSAEIAGLAGRDFIQQPPDFDVDKAAGKLIELLKSESLRSKLGKESRQYILANHCRKVNAEKIVSAYAESIEKFKIKGRKEKIERIEKVLDQIKSISQGLDQWLYDLLFVRSLRFRVSHWLKKFRKSETAGRK